LQISFSFARVPARTVVLEPPKWENRGLYSRSVAVPQRFWKVVARWGEISNLSRQPCRLQHRAFGEPLSGRGR
jgi:DNA/RNA endonuclease G (NUC1)